MQAKMAYLAGFVLSRDKNSFNETIFNDQEKNRINKFSEE